MSNKEIGDFVEIPRKYVTVLRPIISEKIAKSSKCGELSREQIVDLAVLLYTSSEKFIKEFGIDPELLAEAILFVNQAAFSDPFHTPTRREIHATIKNLGSRERAIREARSTGIDPEYKGRSSVSGRKNHNALRTRGYRGKKHHAKNHYKLPAIEEVKLQGK